MTQTETHRGAAVIIPAYNEADRIGDTVRAASAIPGVSRVVVVDDGSEDETSDAARAAGAYQVVTMPANRGKGAALNAGLQVVTEPVILLLDADLAESAAEGCRLLQPVLEGQADMAIAAFRNTGSGGGFGFAVGLARRGIKRLTGHEMISPLSGQRCVTRKLLEAVGGFERGFGVETALTIDAARQGFQIQEVQTTMGHRVTGRDFAGMLHRGRQFVDIALVLIRRAFRGAGGKVRQGHPSLQGRGGAESARAEKPE